MSTPAVPDLPQSGEPLTPERLLACLTGAPATEDEKVSLQSKSTMPLHADLKKVIISLLRDFSRDNATFYSRYRTSVRDALKAMESQDSPVASKPLLQTLLLLGKSVEASAEMSKEGIPPDSDEVKTLNEKLKQAQITDYLRDLFEIRPPTEDEIQPPLNFETERKRTQLVLEDIDWSSIEVHRIGTTSLILKVKRLSDAQEQYVLKLVHFLFQEVEPIAAATADYRREIAGLIDGCPNVVLAHASSSGWIIEDYVHGDTLAEYVFDEFEEHSASVAREKLFRDLYIPLVRAVERLHRASRLKPHGDLSPSNILIQNGGKTPGGIFDERDSKSSVIIRFIDVGRNFLASDTIGRVHSPDSHFIAPEARQLPVDDQLLAPEADYYSLGLLLAFCMGAGADELEAGDIPEILFREEPILARLVADLSDPRPAWRLRVMQRDFKKPTRDLATLSHYLLQLREAFAESRRWRRRTRSKLTMITDSLVVTQGIQSIVARLAGELTEKKLPLAAQYRYLAKWERIAWSSYIVCNLVIAFNLAVRHLQDAGLGAFGHWVKQFANGPLKDLHILAWHTSTAYDQAALVGASYTIAAYRYYMIAFGEVDLRHCEPGGFGRWFSSKLLRFQTVVVFPFVLIGNWWFPTYWMWIGTAGYLTVALNNRVMRDRQTAVNRRLTERMNEIGLNQGYWRPMVVPADDSTRDEPRTRVVVSVTLNDWAATLFLFSVITGTMAASLTLGAGHDYWVDAGVWTIVNIVFFTLLHAMRQGPRIAPDLIRSAVLGERMQLNPEAAEEVEYEPAMVAALRS